MGQNCEVVVLEVALELGVKLIVPLLVVVDDCVEREKTASFLEAIYRRLSLNLQLQPRLHHLSPITCRSTSESTSHHIRRFCTTFQHRPTTRSSLPVLMIRTDSFATEEAPFPTSAMYVHAVSFVPFSRDRNDGRSIQIAESAQNSLPLQASRNRRYR